MTGLRAAACPCRAVQTALSANAARGRVCRCTDCRGMPGTFAAVLAALRDAIPLGAKAGRGRSRPLAAVWRCLVPAGLTGGPTGRRIDGNPMPPCGPDRLDTAGVAT